MPDRENKNGYMMKDDNALVSIIVRTKDRPMLLQRALRSIAAQQHRMIEVIVVNDGGCVLDLDVLKNILCDIPMTYIKLEQNSGRPHAGNVGLANTTGSYIGFLDDDDEFYPDHITTLLEGLNRETDCSAAYADSEIIEREYREDGSIVRELNKGTFRSWDFSFAVLFFENFIPLNSILFRKDVMGDVAEFDESFELFEDWDFFIRVSSIRPFYHIPKVTSKYIQWSKTDQIAFVNLPNAMDYYLKVLTKHWDKITPDVAYHYFAAKQDEIGYLSHAVSEKQELKELFMEREERLKAKDIYIEQLIRQSDELKNELRSREHYFEQFQNSLGWKLLDAYRSRIKPRIFAPGSRRETAYLLALKGLSAVITKGPKVTFGKLKERIRQKFAQQRIKNEKFVLPAIHPERPEMLDRKVSAIIPTKNAGGEFRATLQKLRAQKGVRNLEIIVVDSGSSDDTLKIAEHYGAKTFSIKPEDFNHGAVRNLGAEKATGDYLVFLSQDVIPIGVLCIYSLIKIMESDPLIAAATARQIPRSDADLFACWQLWYYYNRVLCLSDDHVSSIDTTVFSSLSPDEKRKVSQLDNIFSCIRKDIFYRFKFNTVAYAEDLDLGLRLISQGYKMAFFSTIGVVHSHTRTPDYYFRRSFVDVKHLIQLLDYKPISWNDFAIASADDMLGCTYAFYRKINALADMLRNTGERLPASELVVIIERLLRDPETISSSRGESSMEDLFSRLFIGTNMHSVECNGATNILVNQYIDLIRSFGEFLNVYGGLSDKNDELIMGLYKLFAVVGGSNMGSYAVYAEDSDNVSGVFPETLSGVLEKGV